MASVKPKLNQRLKLKLTQHFCTALTAMVLDTMAMLVWDTMVTLVLDISATVMVLAMVITMERGKLNLLLKLLLRLKLTQLCFTAAMDMASGITAMLGLDTLAMLVLVIMDMADILAMATMASVQHRWCNIFSCHCSESKESQTFIESDEIVIKEQIMFPKSLFLFYSFLSH